MVCVYPAALGPETIDVQIPRTLLCVWRTEWLSCQTDEILAFFWLSEKSSGSQDMSKHILGPRPGAEVSCTRASCIGNGVCRGYPSQREFPLQRRVFAL